MLKPTLKSVGATEHERYLSKLSERSFFGLWSYPNIYTDEGIGKNGSGRELCDLLVVFESTVVIFSDKSIAFKEDIDVHTSWKRWFRRSVVKSAKQLYGAEAWIKQHSNRLYLNKNCTSRLPIEIDPSELKIHLVATTENVKHSAEKYWGGAS